MNVLIVCKVLHQPGRRRQDQLGSAAKIRGRDRRGTARHASRVPRFPKRICIHVDAVPCKLL